MMGTNGGERRNAFAALERSMQSSGVSWTDIGDAVEHDSDGKYTEDEMQEFAQAARAERVDEGIRIGTARASNGNGNGHLTLPAPLEMAEDCDDRAGRLKDNAQRVFIEDMVLMTRRRVRLSSGRLSYLSSIYIKISGTTG
jgi:hypothetical protein